MLFSAEMRKSWLIFTNALGIRTKPRSIRSGRIIFWLVGVGKVLNSLCNFHTSVPLVKDVLEHLMWNETLGAWFDYDSVRNEQRTYFFASNVAPLWAECLRYALVQLAPL